MSSLNDHIVDSAQKPQEVAGEGGSMKMPKIDEQIEADRYRAANNAAKLPMRGVYLTRLLPPGAVE